MERWIKILTTFIGIAFKVSAYGAEKDSLFIPMREVSERAFCDACGCAAGNGSSGFESLLNPQFIGIKYFAQHYKARENLFVNDLNQDQYFNTVQLWARIPLGKKWSIYGSIPLQFHDKKTAQGDVDISGVGDANLMALYQIMQSDSGSHQLNAGAGIKIPLGRFDEKGLSGVNPSFQLGTGSWDYQWALSYRFQKNSWALMLNSDYTIKTENKKHYQFGNQWNYAATGFYRIFQRSQKTLALKLGFQGEVYDRNQQYSEPIPDTAGSALYSKIGFETAVAKVSLGAEWMMPVYSRLAGGDIAAKSRMSIFVNIGL